MADEYDMEKNSDALFRFALSEDGMKLGVSRYFPPNGGEGPSVELLRRQVAAAGISLPIDQNAAEQIISAIQRDGEIRRIVLVRGIEVQEPQHATLVALGNLDFPVFPGDRFARKHPPQKARNGETIDGRITKPKEHFEPDDIQVIVGDNVDFDSLTHSYVSQVWGMARLHDGTISVDPIAHITDDEIAVIGTLHHKDFRGQAITAERLGKELRDMGVVIEIDMEKLATKLKNAAVINLPLTEQVLVEGTYPIPGHDGWLEYLVSTRELAGVEESSGRFNFRDRGSYPMVEAGQIIGRLHGPTPGQGGIDIYGKTIPASGGHELIIHLGENVAAHEDKVTFEAKAKGIVSIERNVLSVTDCLLITGNVDLNTGNIIVEHGSVKILGSIQGGFKVSAPKHVIVSGSIESAFVNAGGNVEVSGGILMPDGGKITADGDVVAAYTTNARIRAGGDVHIANDITNTEIHTEGRLYATRGKGHIQGGEIVTAKGMEVNEIGSELGVTTSVAVLIEHDEDEMLRMERVKIKKALQKIDEALGTDPPEIILERTKPEKRAVVAEVLKHRITLIKRRKTISEQLTQLALNRQEELRGITIKALRLLHPGVTIKFGGKRICITKRTEASTLYWDVPNRDIVFA